MSKRNRAASTVNRLVKDGYDLLGSSDGPALMNFLEDYFCGDDPDDYDDSSGKVSHTV